MNKSFPEDSDKLLEILRAYRLPTIIIAAGLILSVAGFHLALRYDMGQSERAFLEISEQVYNNFDNEMRRHKYIIGAMARTLGQIRGLTEEEFADASAVYIDTTFFANFYFYKFQSGDGLIKLGKDSVSAKGGSITEFFSDAGSRSLENIGSLPETRLAVEQAQALNNVYISRPYKQMNADKDGYYVVFAAPVPERHMKNLFLVGLLDVDRLLKSAFSMENRTMNIRVMDVAGADKTEIFRQIEPGNDKFFTLAGERSTSILSFHRDYHFDNNVWNISFSASMKDLTNYVGLLPWIIFLSLLTVTSLLSFIVFQITTENLKIHLVVEKQTRSLREYTERLELSNRDLDDFAYIASHDLKEPLRGMYNFAEFLKEDYHDKLDAAGQEKLDRLKALARRMESFIESLLEYSRLSRIDMAFRQTDINQAVRTAIGTLEIWLEERNAVVSVEENLPTIVCDRVRVTEIFRNLITNAVKYNDSPVKRVEIGCLRNFEDWGDIPVFYVRDNGIGIAPEHWTHIFKIFKRLHAREKYEGGTGAGLTIILKIIERHSGKIWLESTLEKGTVFYFTLMRKDHGSA